MKANYLIFKLCLLLTIILFVILFYLEFYCKFEHLSFYMNIVFAIFGGTFLTSITTFLIYKNELKEKKADIFLDLLEAYKRYNKLFSLHIIKDTPASYIGEIQMNGIHTLDVIFEKMNYLELKLGVTSSNLLLGDLSDLYELMSVLRILNSEVSPLPALIELSDNSSNNELIEKYRGKCTILIDEMKKIILEICRKEFGKDIEKNMKFRLEEY